MDTPFRIEASAAFGQTQLPDGGSVTFGDMSYESESYRKGEPALIVKATAVFGQVVVDAVRRSRDAEPEPAPAPDSTI